MHDARVGFPSFRLGETPSTGQYGSVRKGTERYGKVRKSSFRVGQTDKAVRAKVQQMVEALLACPGMSTDDKANVKVAWQTYRDSFPQGSFEEGAEQQPAAEMF